MRAKELLAEYARCHDAGVRSGDWAPLAALFADDGEIAFDGVPVGPVRGAAEIERVFREHGPDDVFAIGPLVRTGRTTAAARYAWSRSPGEVAGTLRLAANEGRIARLVIRVGTCDLPEPEPRRSVRGVVHTPAGDALLLRIDAADGSPWWVTPGGGIELGEEEVPALRRELAEEAGLTDAPIGPCVWTREHLFEWGPRVYRQHERFRQVRVPSRFDPAPGLDAAGLRAEAIGAVRWWSPAELAGAGEVFAPLRLPELLARLVAEGPPPAPVDAGE